MRRLRYIFLLFLFCPLCILPIRAEIQIELPDTIIWEKDSSHQTPLLYDTLTYNKFKSDEFYNYYESRVKQESILDQIRNYIIRWINRNLNKTLNRKEVDTILWIIGLLFIAVVGFIIYRFNPGLFYINRKKEFISYSVEEETIHGQNFDELIKQALQKGEYRDAIRWQYLKTLKFLNEREIISWDPYKTVNEYVYEIKNTDAKTQFRELSREFVFYRYGNGFADEERFHEFKSLSEKINRIYEK